MTLTKRDRGDGPRCEPEGDSGRVLWPLYPSMLLSLDRELVELGGSWESHRRSKYMLVTLRCAGRNIGDSGDSRLASQSYSSMFASPRPD